jgi:hypothetical protein
LSGAFLFSLNNLLQGKPRPGTARWAFVHLLPALLLSYGAAALLSAAVAWLLAQWWQPAQVTMAVLVFSLGFYTVIFMYVVSRPQPGLALIAMTVLSVAAGTWLWL